MVGTGNDLVWFSDANENRVMPSQDGYMQSSDYQWQDVVKLYGYHPGRAELPRQLHNLSIPMHPVR